MDKHGCIWMYRGYSHQFHDRNPEKKKRWKWLHGHPPSDAVGRPAPPKIDSLPAPLKGSKANGHESWPFKEETWWLTLIFILIVYNNWLVVYLPLWKIWKSVGIIIPNIWKNKKCSKPPSSCTTYGDLGGGLFYPHYLNISQNSLVDHRFPIPWREEHDGLTMSELEFQETTLPLWDPKSTHHTPW